MNKKRIGLLSMLYYITVFFPYIKITPFKIDTQPGAIVTALIIIVLSITIKHEKIPKKIIPFIWIAYLVIPIFLLGEIKAEALRSLLGYLSFPIILFGGYLIIKSERGVNTKLLKLVIWVWFFIALIQITVNPYFGNSIISDMRTSETRGVNSLAIEPTYFGQMMYFLLFYALVFLKSKKEKLLYSLICIVAIVLMAKSSMIALILVFNILVISINTFFKKTSLKNIKNIFMLAVFIVIGLIIFSYVPESSRLVTTATNILDKGLVGFFKEDASSNFRLSAIYYSFKGSIESLLIPNGFNNWIEYEMIQKSQSSYFWFGISPKIMSMYGALLYELGFIGLYLIYMIHKYLLKFIKSLNLEYYKIPILCYIHMIFMTAVPIATPFVGFLVATFIYYSVERDDIYIDAIN